MCKRKKIAKPALQHRPTLIKKKCFYALASTEKAGRRHLYKLVAADYLGSRIVRCWEGGNFIVFFYNLLYCHKEDGSFL